MSLRDALLKAGAVDKKKVREVERSLKEDRKQQQGHRERKHVVETRERETAEAQRERELRERLEARKARESEREVLARAQRVRQILRHHGIQPAGGPARFHHRDADGVLLPRLELPWTLARGLRSGRMALAALRADYSDEVDYLLVPREVAERVHALEPGALVFFNAEAPDPADESEQLLDEHVDRTVLRPVV